MHFLDYFVGIRSVYFIALKQGCIILNTLIQSISGNWGDEFYIVSESVRGPSGVQVLGVYMIYSCWTRPKSYFAVPPTKWYWYNTSVLAPSSAARYLGHSVILFTNKNNCKACHADVRIMSTKVTVIGLDKKSDIFTPLNPLNHHRRHIRYHNTIINGSFIFARTANHVVLKWSNIVNTATYKTQSPAGQHDVW